MGETGRLQSSSAVRRVYNHIESSAKHVFVWKEPQTTPPSPEGTLVEQVNRALRRRMER